MSVEDFFAAYAAAFEAKDAVAVAALYSYPAHVASDTGEDLALVALPSPAAFVPQIQRLLEMYRRVGMKKVRVLKLEVEQLSSRLRRGTVTWGLLGLADLPLYQFEASYVLGRFDGAWKAVSVVSHNELQRHRAFIGRG